MLTVLRPAPPPPPPRAPLKPGSAFGSHVAEGALARLGAAAAAGGLSDEDAAALAALLGDLAGALGDSLYDYLMDRHATHVARALLRVAAGRDVVPASKQGKQKQRDGGGGGAGAAGARGGVAKVRAPHVRWRALRLPPVSPWQLDLAAPLSRPPVQGNDPLAEKLAGSHSSEAPPPLFPALLSRLARMLPCYDPPSMAALAKNTYSGPFLQGVLRAAAGDRCAEGLFLSRVWPRGGLRGRCGSPRGSTPCTWPPLPLASSDSLVLLPHSPLPHSAPRQRAPWAAAAADAGRERSRRCRCGARRRAGICL